MNSDKPLLQLMDEFLSNQDIRENSRKKYRENLHVFIGWLTRNCKDIANPLRSEVITYKEYLIQSGKAATTIDAYMVPVRQFFKWMEEEKIYDNVAAGIRSPRRYQGDRKDYLQADQIDQLLSCISKTGITGKRDYAIINLMCNTGMRCVEISRLDLLDISPTKDGFNVAIQGKGHINKDRSVTIPHEVMFPIQNYLIERSDLNGTNNPPMFVNHSYCSPNTRFTRYSISKNIKRYLRSIGIDNKRISAHSIRHSAAINAIKAGANIVDVQSMLGHKDSRSTDIYLKALQAESAEEGTAIRLLGDYYKNNKKRGKDGQIGPQQ
jgi:integrase/recombinase XerC/integrase/recombinase XerD